MLYSKHAPVIWSMKRINCCLTLRSHKKLQINDDVVWKRMKQNRPWYKTSHNGIMQTNWSQTNPILKREWNYVNKLISKGNQYLWKVQHGSKILKIKIQRPRWTKVWTTFICILHFYIRPSMSTPFKKLQW